MDQSSNLSLLSGSNLSFGEDLVTSTPIKRHKPYIYNFIENLFKINMSEDALVDIIIDDDSDVSKVIIVGRPKLLGSSTRQMCHVTPYSFIEHAIKSAIMMTKGQDDYQLYIDNIKRAILPLIKSKKGICLKRDQYNKLLSIVSSKDDVYEAFNTSPR